MSEMSENYVRETEISLSWMGHLAPLQSKGLYLSQSFNPFNPNRDEHLISPYNITPESHIKVMGIKKMIINEGGFWLVDKISLSTP